VNEVGTLAIHPEFVLEGVLGDWEIRYPAIGFVVLVAVKEETGTTSDVEVAGRVNEVIVGGVEVTAQYSSAPISHAEPHGRVCPSIS
jgi:hypothetical protein